MRIAIAWKILGLVIFLIAVLGILSGAYFIKQQENFFAQDFDKRAKVLLQSAALNFEYPVITGDKEALRTAAKAFLSDKSVAYITIYGEDNKILFKGNNLDNRRHTREYAAPIITEKATAEDAETFQAGKETIKQQRIGSIVLGVSMADMAINVTAMKRAILFFLLTSICIASLLVAALIRVTLKKPVDELTEGARRIASGNLNYKVAVHSNDELGDLANAFNRMTDDLKKVTLLRDYVDGILASMADALIVIDREDKISMANKAAQQLWGEDILEKRTTELIAHPELMTLAGFQAWAKNHVIANFETSTYAGNGLVPLLLSGSLLEDNNGNTVGIVLLFHDITFRKQAENELRQANALLAENETRLKTMLEESRRMQKELVAAKDKLVHSEKMASLGQLAAGVAHEINNPLGYVISNFQTLSGYIQTYERVLAATATAVQSLQDNTPIHTVKDYFNTAQRHARLDYIRQDAPSLLIDIQEGLDRMKKIILDLKTFAHADTATPSPHNINEIVERSISIAWNAVKYKAEVVRDLGKIPPIFCNESRLSQVFINLLVNAAQAIEKTGIIRIETRFNPEKKLATVKISDTGKGISPEHMKKIFDPFFTTKPVGQGTGLGLSISYDIIKQHDGEITVESVVNQGTTFTVALPTTPPKRQPA